jgi:hypothetical protein
MRLGSGETTLTIGTEMVRLRPTLRAGYRLENRYGFDVLLRAIAGGSLTHIADVIGECSDQKSSIPDVLKAFEAYPLRHVEAVALPVMNLVIALAGMDIDASDKPTASTGERITFNAYYTKLFEIGTGWLGWTAEATWNATPAEILAAHKGRVDLLKAIFGSKSDSDPTAPLHHSEADITEAHAKLKAWAATGANRSPT